MLNLLILIAIIILVIWVLGLVLGFLGPFVWVLLVIGLIFLIIWFMQRGRVRR